MNKIREFANRNMRQYGMLAALIVIMIVFGIITKGSLVWPRNVSMLVRQNSYVLILAIGMMLCILTGGNIDLSVGSLVALVSAMSGFLATTLGLPAWLAIIISLLTGLLAGMWQGFWIAFVKVPPFIATLSGMLIFRGLNNIILDGQTIPLPQLYKTIGGGSVPDFLPNTVPDFLKGQRFPEAAEQGPVSECDGIGCRAGAVHRLRGVCADQQEEQNSAGL